MDVDKYPTSEKKKTSPALEWKNYVLIVSKWDGQK